MPTVYRVQRLAHDECRGWGPSGKAIFFATEGVANRYADTLTHGDSVRYNVAAVEVHTTAEPLIADWRTGVTASLTAEQRKALSMPP